MSSAMVITSTRRRLGEMLVGQGLVTEPALTRALAAQKRVGHRLRLGGVLLGSGLVSEEALLDALSRLHHCPSVGWSTLSHAKPEVVALLNGTRAVRLEAIPYAIEKTTLKVAFRDPSNIQAVDEVAAVTGRRVQPAVTSEVRLMQAHEKFYARAMSGQFWNVLKRLDGRPAALDAAPAPSTLPPPPQFSATPESEPEVPREAVPFLDSGEGDSASSLAPSGEAVENPFSDRVREPAAPKYERSGSGVCHPATSSRLSPAGRPRGSSHRPPSARPSPERGC
ncbi:MAG: hypothetical protein LC796_05555 [Acidobacteria bacterium]|nr:hypothetical protein [Acidobacteriota bacterium]